MRARHDETLDSTQGSNDEIDRGLVGVHIAGIHASPESGWQKPRLQPSVSARDRVQRKPGRYDSPANGCAARPPSTKLNPTPAPPEFTGFRPVDFQNPYAAGTPAGFYPFSEIGYIHFGPDPDDAIEGWLRENTCGYDLNANQHVTGKYKFDANNATGVYTIQLDVVTNHIWDYHFVTVSDDEIKLQAAGRLPRPAVGTGILRRMS